MKIILLMVVAFFLYANPVFPISKTKFIELDQGQERVVNLENRDFIVITLRERNSGGKIYCISKDGTVWLYGVISSGAYGHRTPTGVHRIVWKKRKHMSTKYPDPSGRNNMDFSLFFTTAGHAIHLGNPQAMSHGCIHLGYGFIEELFENSKINTPVVVIRGYYDPFTGSQSVNSFNQLSLF